MEDYGGFVEDWWRIGGGLWRIMEDGGGFVEDRGLVSNRRHFPGSVKCGPCVDLAWTLCGPCVDLVWMVFLS
jgi:hypothetical protein